MSTKPKSNIVLYLVIFAISILGIYTLLRINKSNGSYVRSSLNGKEYYVRDYDNKEEAAYMLSVVDERLMILKRHLLSNINSYDKYRPYIMKFCEKIDNLFIYENSLEDEMTSYTVNKGDETVICLRSKNQFGKLHDINLITYVALHEVSHIACPEIDHTDLFKEIFKFFIDVSSKIGIYKKVDYQLDPTEYCGLVIHDKLH